jgi:hypothetical protein
MSSQVKRWFLTKPRLLSPLMYQMPMPRNLQRRFCFWRRKASAPRCICEAVKTNAKSVERSGRGLILRAQSRDPRSNYNAKMYRNFCLQKQIPLITPNPNNFKIYGQMATLILLHRTLAQWWWYVRTETCWCFETCYKFLFNKWCHCNTDSNIAYPLGMVVKPTNVYKHLRVSYLTVC